MTNTMQNDKRYEDDVILTYLFKGSAHWGWHDENYIRTKLDEGYGIVTPIQKDKKTYNRALVKQVEIKANQVYFKHHFNNQDPKEIVSNMGIKVDIDGDVEYIYCEGLENLSVDEFIEELKNSPCAPMSKIDEDGINRFYIRLM